MRYYWGVKNKEEGSREGGMWWSRKCMLYWQIYIENSTKTKQFAKYKGNSHGKHNIIVFKVDILIKI